MLNYILVKKTWEGVVTLFLKIFEKLVKGQTIILSIEKVILGIAANITNN